MKTKTIVISLILGVLLIIIAVFSVNYSLFTNIDRAIIGEWVNTSSGVIWKFKGNGQFYMDGELWGNYTTKDGDLALKYMNDVQADPTYLYHYTISGSELYCYDEDEEREFVKIE